MCDEDLLRSHVDYACPSLYPLLSPLLSPLHTLFSPPGSEAQIPQGCAQLGCPGDAQDDQLQELYVAHKHCLSSEGPLCDCEAQKLVGGNL